MIRGKCFEKVVLRGVESFIEEVYHLGGHFLQHHLVFYNDTHIFPGFLNRWKLHGTVDGLAVPVEKRTVYRAVQASLVRT